MEAPSGSDPVSKWTVREGETGLEEPLGQLGLGGGPESYPERPGEVDCRYYLRTGYCGYGNRCRFNHPRDRTMVMGAMRASRGDYPERLGQPVCQYYMKTGMCKFGASCRYHHPSQGDGSPMPTTLNIYGYPLRPGEKECSYYVKSGQCKFGVACKFHHPQPAGVQVAAPVPGPAPVSLAASTSTEPAAEADPAEAALHEKIFAHRLAEIRSIPEDFLLDLFAKAAQAMVAVKATGGDYKKILEQPISQLFHPRQGGESSMPTALNICGYPLRPGEKECSYYLKSGRCKFGAMCRFNHPQPAGVQVAAPGPNQQHGGLSFPAPSGIIPMSGSFAVLPRELLSNILVRLPAKSIGISRCVSKPWLSLLTSYQFIKAALAHHTHLAQEQKLLLRSSSDSLFSLTLHQSHGSHFSELEFNDERVVDFVGSCNGLVLVSTGGRVMWLVNFMIEEIVKLPASPFPLCPHLSFKKYGFGYDEVSDDYKIVKISQCDYGQTDDEPHCPEAEIFVDIYSLKMRSWKRLGTPLYGHSLLHHDSCVFINGAFHWLGLKNAYSDKESTVIGSLDVSDEKIKEFPAPASLNDDFEFLSAKLMVMDGCLGIVGRPNADQKTEIWVMKSYSVVESWTKLVVDFRPICFHEGRILFKGEGDGVLKWHCEKDGSVEACLVVDDGGLRFAQGVAYTESLVSPHFKYHDNQKGKKNS